MLNSCKMCNTRKSTTPIPTFPLCGRPWLGLVNNNIKVTVCIAHGSSTDKKTLSTAFCFKFTGLFHGFCISALLFFSLSLSLLIYSVKFIHHCCEISEPTCSKQKKTKYSLKKCSSWCKVAQLYYHYRNIQSQKHKNQQTISMFNVRKFMFCTACGFEFM